MAAFSGTALRCPYVPENVRGWPVAAVGRRRPCGGVAVAGTRPRLGWLGSVAGIREGVGDHVHHHLIPIAVPLSSPPASAVSATVPSASARRWATVGTRPSAASPAAPSGSTGLGAASSAASQRAP